MSQVQLGSPVLSVSDLCVTFTKKKGSFRRVNSVITAVDRVSFDLNQAEFICIAGESGSGKTTLARCLMGLAGPTSGTIKYNGKEVSALKLKEYWRDVQMIFQDPFESLNPRHSVLSAVSNPIRFLNGEKDSREIRDKVETLLKEVGLKPDEVMYRLPHELSGGQRQRVNIARALASNPKVLIADEPITMLDAAQRLNVLLLLKELKAKRGISIVMVTHDLASALMTSDRVLVMYLGKVVEMGPTSEVLSSPLHPYVQLILASSPSMKDKEEKDDKWTDEASRTITGCRFSPRCAYATEICGRVDPDLIKRAHYAACHNPLE
ncbi:MAG: ABC transporter ATP-binding protein [Nitrososphaerales archaeon]